MKKFFKIFAAALLITFTIVLMFNIFQSKPFNFESFKTAEEAKSYLDEHYLGTDIDKVLKDIALAGAKSKEMPEKIKENFEYDTVYICRYSNNFISSDPLSAYLLLLYADVNRKLVDIFVRKESKIEFP